MSFFMLQLAVLTEYPEESPMNANRLLGMVLCIGLLQGSRSQA